MNKKYERVAGCIHIYDNVIDNPEYFINLFNDSGEWENSLLVSTDGSSYIDKSVRSSSALKINDYDFHRSVIRLSKKIYQICGEYAMLYDIELGARESPYILKYEPGEYVENHIDYDKNNSRLLSAILYLNDVDQGGELQFTNFDITVKPKKGRLVIFPAGYAYSHKALPPISSKKYAILFWIKG